jgi:hypothetical protein
LISYERAYKKLKGSVYYDKTQSILRASIVDFEGDGNIDNLLSALRDKVKASEDDWESYKSDLLSSIKVVSFPKSIKGSNNGNTILNYNINNIKVDHYQFFFDSMVEVQILGIIWISTIGVELDATFYTHSYGNRLRKRIAKEVEESVYKLSSGVNDNEYLIGAFSPYLFEPYFSQYESWRDKGLEIAQTCLTNKENVLVLTMDFKSFFHSVDLNKVFFDEFMSNYIDKYTEAVDSETLTEISRINTFVYEVLEYYSSISRKVIQSNDEKQNIFLPIGFFPSNILSNWYLDKFDRAIIDRWNPTYYGRYVDDIIIVDKVESNSRIHKILSQQSSSGAKENLSERIINHYLGKCNAKKDLICDAQRQLLTSNSDVIQDGQDSNEEVLYRVNSHSAPLGN